MMQAERIANMERWDYARSLNGQRVKKLLAAPSFEEITAEIKKEMKVLCFHCENLQDNKKDDKNYERAVYCIHMGEKLFDWFFNSKNGYRAAYFRSPFEGLETNQNFIESLTPELIASDKTTPNFDKKFIEESLKSPSAKAWLAEVGKNLCEHCSGEWNSRQDNNEPEILNNRWENNIGQNAEWGRKAPYLTKIRIIGAFLNDHYDEFIPSSKRFRAKDINEDGWS